MKYDRIDTNYTECFMIKWADAIGVKLMIAP